ncbi:MAG: ATP-grasp domain-containing protein [Desulfobacterium sp.]|nr:ATP-grasp domain-containing protein [Desulfobacterium sp.]
MRGSSPVLRGGRILVVGTTPDYVEWIRRAWPGRALFLTDPDLRRGAGEPCPSPWEEILCPVGADCIHGVRQALGVHLEQWGQTITGIACFDCESMETAALVAAGLSLAYPSVQAVRKSRDKLRCKKIWQNNGVSCPRSIQVDSPDQVMAFMAGIAGMTSMDGMSNVTGMNEGIVLKPCWGSGSELVFCCTTDEECERSFKILEQGLAQRSTNPLFGGNASRDDLITAEEFIRGTEFSCDFVVENNAVTIVRTTRKIKAVGTPFGTILGYQIPAFPLTVPGMGPAFDELEDLLLRGAAALGIERGICMVDFIVKDGKPVLIEMTPRPGGDCLPFLLVESGSLDILGLTLDFAEKKSLTLSGPDGFKPSMAVRIFAPKGGILKRIDPSRLQSRSDIKKIHFTRKPGHRITMPPGDYDSWLLGHVIVELPHDFQGHFIDEFCLGVSSLVRIEME